MKPDELEEAAVSTEKQPSNNGLLVETYKTLGDVAMCLIFVTIIFVFAIRLVGVVGSSMVPTLENGDRLTLLSNFLYTPKTGDIVVLRKESFETDPIVKRVIADEGQTVDIDFETGSVYVDGELLDEPYINEPTYREEGTQFPLTVPENCIFIMGDNRNHSTDSRYTDLGCVDKRYVLGKVLQIILPFNRIGVVR